MEEACLLLECRASSAKLPDSLLKYVIIIQAKSAIEQTRTIHKNPVKDVLASVVNQNKQRM